MKEDHKKIVSEVLRILQLLKEPSPYPESFRKDDPELPREIMRYKHIKGSISHLKSSLR